MNIEAVAQQDENLFIVHIGGDPADEYRGCIVNTSNGRIYHEHSILSMVRFGCWERVTDKRRAAVAERLVANRRKPEQK